MFRDTAWADIIPADSYRLNSANRRSSGTLLPHGKDPGYPYPLLLSYLIEHNIHMAFIFLKIFIKGENRELVFDSHGAD